MRRALSLALCAGLLLIADKPPPQYDKRSVTCREVWGHLECKDNRTGQIVQRCRKNHLTGAYECTK